MFIAGLANMRIDIQDVINGVDALGAPTRAYNSYLQCYAQTDGQQYSVTDSESAGPREESAKTITLIVRNHAQLNINTSQRVVDLETGELFSIQAIRYDRLNTVCYLDCVGGVANG